MLGLNLLDRLDGPLRGDVAGIALHADVERRVFATEIARERPEIEIAAEDAQEPRLAFEHGAWTGEAVAREAGRKDAGFRGASDMQALDHRSSAGAGELHQAAAQ